MPTNILILTGAGISAESGIHTYRDLDGLWKKYDPMVVSHIKGWNATPQKVLDFKNELRQQFIEHNYQPNAAHVALTRLQKEWRHGEVTIVTQNIDGLHQQAGSTVLDMHGNGQEKMCGTCGHITPYDADIILDDPCPNCGNTASTRSKVVLFGEMPFHLDEIERKLDECSIFAVIGSSLAVMPANLFVASVPIGTDTYLLNKEPPQTDVALYEHIIYGDATEIVPAWVDELLTRNGNGRLP